LAGQPHAVNVHSRHRSSGSAPGEPSSLAAQQEFWLFSRRRHKRRDGDCSNVHRDCHLRAH